jgi:pre-mRNA-splicing helicase BRR2
VNVLEKHDLIKFDRKSGMLQSTDLGRIASYYYISNESIATYTDLMRPSMNEIDILRVFSLSSEFKFMRVREEEKLELSKLLQRVPIPIKENVEEASAKVNVLIQSYISRLKLEGFAISADMIFIQQSACRLLRALYEISLRKGWGLLSNKILDLCVMTERRLWKSQSPLRQFTSIPELLIRKLEKISDISWEKYLVLKPQDFGEMVKMPKMGKTLHKFVHMIPKLKVEMNAFPISRSILYIQAHLKSDFEFNDTMHGHQLLFWLRIEDGNGEKVLHHEPILVTQPVASRNGGDKLKANIWEYTASFTIPLLDPLPPQYFLRLVSDRWLHSTTVIPINFQHLALPAKFHPPTEILDLNLFPISSFRSKEIEEFFSPLDTLNSIQSQTYYSLYENNENVVICATQGSGKTVCAELALLRFLLKENKDNQGKCLYIAPSKESANLVYRKWAMKIPSLFEKDVVVLTGDLNRDQLLVKNNDIIIATPDVWSNLSRKWKQKKYLFQIFLYIFDDLHMIGQGNPTPDHHQDSTLYESIITRARFMASQLEDSSMVRFVGLSHSVANASDLGSWLGCTNANIFNFPSDYHVGPLHFHLQTIDNYEVGHRLQAMAKPVYDHVVKYSDHNLTMIFVPSRKQAQITSIDLIGYANSLGNKNKYRFAFQSVPQEQLDYFSNQDSLLGTIMQDGVAYIHEGFTEKEINMMQSLCEKQMINVLLVPYTMSYHLQINSHLVVIMDTLLFDGVNGQYIDIPSHYLWSMISKADVHSDYESYVSIFCSVYKKEQIKRVVFESFPLESYLPSFMKDMITEESSNNTVETLTDAVDYLTWTFYYHRLTQNPNFYSLSGTTVRHISDHLSELVENTVTELQENKLLTLEEEINIIPLNLGMISSFYGISSTTIDMMSTALTEKAKVRGIVDILTTAMEFHSLILRFGELNLLHKLVYTTNLKSYSIHLGDEHEMENLIKYKVMILLYAYMSRIPLTFEFTFDLKFILTKIITLLHALIDVIASQGYLSSALSAMELSQLLIQGLSENDSIFLQIPHFSKEFIEDNLTGKKNKFNIETVFDITDLEEEQRNQLFKPFNKKQLLEIANFCNSYPYLDVSYKLSFTENADEGGEVTAGDLVTVNIQVLRDVDEKDTSKIGLVSSRYYPNEKYENWWLMIGDVKKNNLYAIKKLTILRKATVSFYFFLSLAILLIAFFLL